MKKIVSISLIGLMILCCSSTASSKNYYEKNSDQISIDRCLSTLTNEQYDYLIITSEDLTDSIYSSSFINWKKQIGFSLKIVTVSDDEITNQNGIDLAEQIRNFLSEYYQTCEVKYVLLIGDIDTIPMRYCYPDPDNHKNYHGNAILYDILGGGAYPTDHYYADLSSPDNESWDADGDGFHGEIGEDNPDMKAEIRVGRIPTSNPTRVTITLDKIVHFEQDTGAWKQNVLHAGAQMWFPNEIDYHSWKYYFDYGEIYTHIGLDGAFILSEMENNFMDKFNITHFSEQSGKIKSKYEWKSLDKDSFSSTWRNGKFGIVNWVAHGYPFGILRKVQVRQDEDNFSEIIERKWEPMLDIFSNLDDDFPSVVYASSCLVGIPEHNLLGNFAIDLLTKPNFGSAVSIICNTRSPIENPYWPDIPGGSSAMMYTFYRLLINNLKGSCSIGEALFTMKSYHLKNESWAGYWSERYPENANYYLQIDYRMQYSLNLYGDPSLMIGGYT